MKSKGARSIFTHSTGETNSQRFPLGCYLTSRCSSSSRTHKPGSLQICVFSPLIPTLPVSRNAVPPSLPPSPSRLLRPQAWTTQVRSNLCWNQSGGKHTSQQTTPTERAYGAGVHPAFSSGTNLDLSFSIWCQFLQLGFGNTIYFLSLFQESPAGNWRWKRPNSHICIVSFRS